MRFISFIIWSTFKNSSFLNDRNLSLIIGEIVASISCVDLRNYQLISYIMQFMHDIKESDIFAFMYALKSFINGWNFTNYFSNICIILQIIPLVIVTLHFKYLQLKLANKILVQHLINISLKSYKLLKFYLS